MKSSSGSSAFVNIGLRKIAAAAVLFFAALLPSAPAAASSPGPCTMWFKVVHVGTMAPITSGYQVALGLNPSAQGEGGTIDEDSQGHADYSHSSRREVTDQVHNGVLRITNPPPEFTIEYHFGLQGDAGEGVTRNCQPGMMTLLVVDPANVMSGPSGGDWRWVKADASMTSAPSGATTGAPAPTSAAGPPPPLPTSVSGSVATYGDKDLLGFGYPRGADPTAGARLTGLAPDAISVASKIFNHDWPVVTGANDPPASAEFPNTDQIFVGSNQTAQHDGYAGYDKRKQGPAVFRLDYSRLVPAGRTVKSLTLGIAADDFQFRAFNQPFSATVNGQPNKAITDQLNGRDETGPQTYFFTVGIDPSTLTPDHILTLSIDEGGDGGDGFAIDFLTVGVTTSGETAVR